LAQANTAAVERRAPDFVPTIVALQQEQAWTGWAGRGDQPSGSDRWSLNGPAVTTMVAHQLHLSRFCDRWFRDDRWWC
jgi:hypothetical protein